MNVSDSQDDLVSNPDPFYKPYYPTITGGPIDSGSSFRLTVSPFLAELNRYLDRDDDGLRDDAEGLLARAFRPYLVYDGGENYAKEALYLYQLRPITPVATTPWQNLGLGLRVVSLHHTACCGKCANYAEVMDVQLRTAGADLRTWTISRIDYHSRVGPTGTCPSYVCEQKMCLDATQPYTPSETVAQVWPDQAGVVPEWVASAETGMKHLKVYLSRDLHTFNASQSACDWTSSLPGVGCASPTAPGTLIEYGQLLQTSTSPPHFESVPAVASKLPAHLVGNAGEPPAGLYDHQLITSLDAYGYAGLTAATLGGGDAWIKGALPLNPRAVGIISRFKSGKQPLDVGAVLRVGSSIDAKWTYTITQWIDAIADVDGDGRAEVILREPGLGLAVLGEDSGSLHWQRSFAMPHQGLEVFAVGDFDGDGAQDMAVALEDPAGQKKTYLMGGKTGADQTLDSWNQDGSSKGLVGDFDGNKVDELVWRGLDGVLRIRGAKKPMLSVAPGTELTKKVSADGTLTNKWKYAATDTVAATGDFNGDGRSELVLRRQDGSELGVFVFVQAATGFAAQPVAIAGVGGTLGTWSYEATASVVGTADLTGVCSDGLLLKSDKVFVLLGLKGYGMTTRWKAVFGWGDSAGGWTFGSGDSVATIGDIDGNGVPELVLRNSSSVGIVSLLSGGFWSVRPFGSSPSSGPYNNSLGSFGIDASQELVGMGDIDGDGASDLVVAPYDKNGGAAMQRPRRPSGCPQ
jgi:hypothetical protein